MAKLYVKSLATSDISAIPLLCRAGLHLMLAPTRLLQPLLRTAAVASAFARDLLRPEHALTAIRFNAAVSSHRVFDTRRFMAAEFECIRALVPGATVNDAVLAVCSGGLRRYLDAHAELPLADLAAIVPLDIGSDNGPASASRRIEFGTCLADAVQRLARIQAQTSAPPPISVMRGLAPPACTVTHVPGPAASAYLHGARMTYVSAILPIADGMGLVFAVSGYDARIVVSPTSCRELMPDPQAFTQCVRDSFQEYLALATAPLNAAKTSRSATPRASAADRRSPAVRSARNAATHLAAAPAGRQRSTAPRR